MCYGADVPVSGDYIGAGDGVQYERPPRKARYAWFDFFPDRLRVDDPLLLPNGPSDSDYLRNRIARLTFDLKTAEAQIEKVSGARPLRTTTGEVPARAPASR